MEELNNLREKIALRNQKRIEMQEECLVCNEPMLREEVFSHGIEFYGGHIKCAERAVERYAGAVELQRENTELRVENQELKTYRNASNVNWGKIVTDFNALKAENADLKVQLFIEKYSLPDGRIEVPMIEREDDYIETLAAALERIAHDPKIASEIRRRSEERLRGLSMWNQSEIAVQHNVKHREQSCDCYKEATQ